MVALAPMSSLLRFRRTKLSFICFVELKYLSFLGLNFGVELKNGVSGLWVSPVWRGFTMRIVLRVLQEPE